MRKKNTAHICLNTYFPVADSRSRSWRSWSVGQRELGGAYVTACGAVVILASIVNRILRNSIIIPNRIWSVHLVDTLSLPSSLSFWQEAGAPAAQFPFAFWLPSIYVYPLCAFCRRVSFFPKTRLGLFWQQFICLLLPFSTSGLL